MKDDIGTSGYIIYDTEIKEPIIIGYLAKRQTDASASSTRQKLRAQLAVWFWLCHFSKIFGEPRFTIEVVLVTDSEASMTIIEILKQKHGLKDVLRPDTDIALAMQHTRDTLPWIKLRTNKVKSHIAVEEASNEFYWEANDLADKLATEARAKV